MKINNKLVSLGIVILVSLISIGISSCGGAEEKPAGLYDSNNQSNSDEEKSESESDSYNNENKKSESKSDSYDDDESSSASPSNSTSDDEEAAMQELREQRERERQFREEDAQKENVRKGKYSCLYCNKKFDDGVYDKCMLATNVNGDKIETGLDYLMGPKFCSQECYDKFHEHEHQNHDYIP